MTAALGYAFRRTSARVLLGLALAGSLRDGAVHLPILGSSPWERAIAALVVLVALVIAASLARPLRLGAGVPGTRSA